MEKIICFSFGLSEEEIEKGKASFCRLNRQALPLEVNVITRNMLGVKVIDVLDGTISVDGRSGFAWQDPTCASGSYKYPVVIILATEREQVFQVMRGFKAVLPDPQNIIFAVVTETALNWTFGEYIEHLGAEHEYMQTRNAQDNPDMKKM